MDRNECSSLDFQLGTTGVEATIPTRQWNIKVHKEVNLLNTALLKNHYRFHIYKPNFELFSGHSNRMLIRVKSPTRMYTVSLWFRYKYSKIIQF